MITDKLAKALHISEKEQVVINTAVDHPWACKCLVCKNFWTIMPPDEDGMHGPFAPSELKEVNDDRQ